MGREHEDEHATEAEDRTAPAARQRERPRHQPPSDGDEAMRQADVANGEGPGG